jgi:hypothetical protein
VLRIGKRSGQFFISCGRQAEFLDKINYLRQTYR